MMITEYECPICTNTMHRNQPYCIYCNYEVDIELKPKKECKYKCLKHRKTDWDKKDYKLTFDTSKCIECRKTPVDNQ